MSVSSLWGDDFSIIPEKKQDVKKIVEKVNSPKKASVTKRVKSSKQISVDDKLAEIKENVLKILGRYKSNTQVIRSREDLTKYIDSAIANGEIAIDTETNNSLDPLTCKLMGPCIYTPGQKNAYIPINHIDYKTGNLLENQLTESDVLEEFSRLDGTNIITHNGKFDYQVIKCTTGYQMKIFWDTMIGAKILDENERSAGLKQQYIEKIDPSIEKYSIDYLFEDVEYAIVDPDIFALYAATDSYMTFRLYEWQRERFLYAGNENLFSMFKDIEMPIVEVAAEMELSGVTVDAEYSKRLSNKYNKLLLDVDKEIAVELENYTDAVAKWSMTDDALFRPPKKTGEGVGKSKLEQLENPINLSSPTQLAILLYDILKQPPVDKNKPRGTGEDILEKIDLPICKLVLKRRGLLKLINTYIDKIPTLVSEKTGRVHTHFNQLGAATGRFSSSDPINLQNIPSSNKAIRMMFKAAPGNVFVGSDFSQQEVRLLAEYADDEHMIDAYRQDKDIYASVAAMIFKNNYEDNKEFWPDGTPNPEGKKRRSFTKSVVLGLMYQRGAHSIAEQIKQPIEKAQQIIDDFYEGFPKVKDYVNRTQEFVKKNGYVEDFWGRRRRLPDVNLPKYEIKNLNAISSFNPFLECEDKVQENDPVIKQYSKLLESVKSKRDYEKIKKDALNDRVEIHDNSGFIAQAERQSVNARIQGGAASLSKIAMIKVYQDEELRRLGFKLLIAVHDELIGECPEENAQEVADRLTHVMKHAGEPTIKINFKCDATIEQSWYLTDYADVLNEHYQDYLKEMDEESAKNKIIADHEELLPEQVLALIQ